MKNHGICGIFPRLVAGHLAHLNQDTVEAGWRAAAVTYKQKIRAKTSRGRSQDFTWRKTWQNEVNMHLLLE